MIKEKQKISKYNTRIDNKQKLFNYLRTVLFSLLFAIVFTTVMTINARNEMIKNVYFNTAEQHKMDKLVATQFIQTHTYLLNDIKSKNYSVCMHIGRLYETVSDYKKAQIAAKAIKNYPQQLLETQNLDEVDAISGASISYGQFVETVEKAVEGKDEGGEDQVPGEGIQIKHALADDVRVARNDPDDSLREESHDERERYRDAQAEADAVPQRRGGPPGLPGADILCGDRGDRHAGGHRNDEDDAGERVYHAGSRRGIDAHGIDDAADKDEREIIGRALQAYRQTDLQYAQDKDFLRPYVTRGKRKRKTLFHEIAQTEHEAERLRDHGSQGRAHGAQSQRAHEAVIQNDIQAGRDQHEHEGCL